MAQTVVIWDTTQFPDQTQRAQRLEKALEMQVAGQTDNVPVVTEGTGTMTVTRTWTTPADAEEWISFITPMNPISATIVTL